MGSYKPAAGQMEDSEGDAKVSQAVWWLGFLNSDIKQYENLIRFPTTTDCFVSVNYWLNSFSREVKMSWNKYESSEKDSGTCTIDL